MHPLKFIKQKFFAPLGGFGNSFFSSWRTPESNANLLHRYNGYVYACVSAIAEDVAMIDFKAYQQLADNSLVEQPGVTLLNILNNPNPLMSKYQLLEMTQTHIELTGEAYWYMELGDQTGKPKSFYLLPPDRMSVAIDKDSELPRIKGYTFLKDNGQQIPLEPEEIVHFKMPNPWDPYHGYGTVEAAIIYIMTEKYGAEFTRNFIYNNAMPAGIVSLKKTIASEAFNEVKRQWKQEYGSLEKAGKTAFLNGVEVEFTKIGTTLSEAALKEIKDMSRDDIMTMFRVSKPILGIFEDVNLASAKTAQYVFMSRVVDPKMARIIDTLQPIIARWNTSGTKFVLGYESPVPEDVDDKLKVYEKGVNSWLTINEVREQEGLKPLPGGSQILQPLNLVAIGAEPPAEKTSKSGHKVIRRTVTRKVTTKSVEYQKKENFRLELIGNQKQWALRFQAEAKKILDAQKKQILDNWKLTEAKKKKLHDDLHMMDVTKAFEEYTFDDAEWQETFTSHLTPLEYELMKEQGAIALAFAGADELEFQLTESVRKLIAERIDRMAENFNTGTKDLLTATLEEGIGNNESIEQIKSRISAIFENSKGYRAERIARTETLTASNAAATEAYSQTGYITREEWLTNAGACEFCDALNGTIVALSESFAPLGTSLEGTEGGIYKVDYANVDYPPVHPNCECTVIPVFDDN